VWVLRGVFIDTAVTTHTAAWLLARPPTFLALHLVQGEGGRSLRPYPCCSALDVVAALVLHAVRLKLQTPRLEQCGTSREVSVVLLYRPYL
jgi:hypothetical protein